MRIYLDNCCYNRPFDDQCQEMNAFKTLNPDSPATIRALGLRALKDALGPVGMARFMQQCEEGYGDYTAEKYNMPDEDMKILIGDLKKIS